MTRARSLFTWVLAAACADSGHDGMSSSGGSDSSSSTSGSEAEASTSSSSSASTDSTSVGSESSSGGESTSSGGADTPTCRECETEPCTRPCLPSLGADGPTLPGAYSQGECPALVTDGRNAAFGFNARDFDLYVPASTHGPYAVVFAWHGAGGSATDFAQALLPEHDANGYVLVVPDGQNRYDSEWHVEVEPGVEGPAATDDLMFFDDVLACLWEQVPIDLRRVHSMGFSVGGRFSAYLMGHRSDRVGSVVTWSGGDRTPQGIIVVPVAEHPIPGLLYHGGATDTPACCGELPTEALATTMVDNGQLAIVCDHGQGHSYPPGDNAAQLWSFMLDHPFAPGADAAWRDAGLPADFPAFCAIQNR